MLSNTHIVEVFMHFWAKLWGLKRVKVGEITVFRGLYTFDNFYLNYCIEVNQVNFSPTVPADVNLDTVHVTTPYPSISTWTWARCTSKVDVLRLY